MIRPAPCAFMCGIDGAAHAEDAGEIDAEHLLPGLDGKLVDGLAIRGLHADAGIVDENVERAGRARRPRRRPRRSRRRPRRRGEKRGAPLRPRRPPRRLPPVAIRVDDARAVRGQRVRDGAPDALGRARDQRDLPARSTCMAFPRRPGSFASGLPQLVITTLGRSLSRKPSCRRQRRRQAGLGGEGAAVGELDRAAGLVLIEELRDESAAPASQPRLAHPRRCQLRPDGQPDVVDANAEFALEHPEDDRVVEAARQPRPDLRREIDDRARVGLAAAEVPLRRQ